MENNLEYSTIYKAKLGDIDSFEKLIRKYQKPIKTFVFCFFENMDLVDDISQEIFIKLFKELKKLRDISNFKAWLFKIAKNTCIDYYKKLKKDKVLINFNESISSYDERIEDKVILKEDIKNLFLKLTPEERITLILVNYFGFSYKEASEILDCSKGTIASRIYYINKKITKIFS
ncbi:unnamed protein product [marine sediment metagenome]|uniref:HTH luxR-type domain-containing protein n=1 Tax=marine sediment metagenome TaxID=412755 RepID=X1A4T8_9ZZZZ